MSIYTDGFGAILSDLTSISSAAQQTADSAQSTADDTALSIAPLVRAQRKNFDVDAQTTDATTSTLYTWQTLGDNRAITLDLVVQGINIATGDVAQWRLTALAYRNGVSTVSVKNVVMLNGPYKDEGASTWDVRVDVDGLDIRIRVTGQSLSTVYWRGVGFGMEKGSETLPG